MTIFKWANRSRAARRSKRFDTTPDYIEPSEAVKAFRNRPTNEKPPASRASEIGNPIFARMSRKQRRKALLAKAKGEPK